MKGVWICFAPLASFVIARVKPGHDESFSISRSRHNSAASNAGTFVRARKDAPQKRTRGNLHGTRIFRDAVASAGGRAERGSRLGPLRAALARSTRLSGMLDGR